VLLLFAGYAVYYWASNRSTDPLTGETVMIDKTISPDDEKAMGLQAWNELLQTEQPLPPNDPNAQVIRGIMQRLVAKVPEVSDALAAEHNLQAQHIEKTFDWDVNVLQSDQVNAFCLPGGKMAVYTGLIPVAQNNDAMAIVMGHEITHALLRHGAQRMTEQTLGADRPDGRRDERHGPGADAGGDVGVWLRACVAVCAQAGDAGRRDGLDVGGGGVLRSAGGDSVVAADGPGERWRVAAGIRVDASESRDAHAESAGVDAEGDGIPQTLLRVR
jgi:hypothetical protein